MDSDIPTKRCSKCGEVKPISEFNRAVNRKPGSLQSWCKPCKAAARKLTYAKNVEMERERGRRYAKKRRTLSAERHYSIKGTWNRNHRDKVNAWNRQRKFSSPTHYQAVYTVSNAVKLGVLPSAKTLVCRKCGAQAEQYHHWSYEPEHWLDVVPVCVECHREIHRQLRAQEEGAP